MCGRHAGKTGDDHCGCEGDGGTIHGKRKSKIGIGECEVNAYDGNKGSYDSGNVSGGKAGNKCNGQDIKGGNIYRISGKGKKGERPRCGKDQNQGSDLDITKQGLMVHRSFGAFHGNPP